MERRRSTPKLNVLPLFNDDFLARGRRMSAVFDEQFFQAPVPAPTRAIPVAPVPVRVIPIAPAPARVIPVAPAPVPASQFQVPLPHSQPAAAVDHGSVPVPNGGDVEELPSDNGDAAPQQEPAWVQLLLAMMSAALVVLMMVLSELEDLETEEMEVDFDFICSEEFFVRSLLTLPWAFDILHTLVEKGFLNVWRTGEIPISVLESNDSYKVEDVYHALKPLWSVSKVWKCDDKAHNRKEFTESDYESEHQCQPPPKLP
ncbi:hypothetical protein R1sor_012880 [Riccia sorocarpa]|uniref:Uncharacterized protein n=1 Tax=Riccia sorocarpa TaxID=122646 RepID=A0ABD3I8E1_9MARC